MTARGARISRFGEYRGYPSPEYDGWQRLSRHMTLCDGTRNAIDPLGYRRVSAPGRIRVTATCDDDTFATPVLDPAPQVSVLRGPVHPSRMDRP